MGIDPISLAIGSAVISGGVAATSKVMEGRERSLAADFEANNHEIQSQQAETRAAQNEADRRYELTTTLENIEVIRAGRGVGEGSPTGQTILTNLIEKEERNIATERLNDLQIADTSRRASFLTRRKAKTSLLSGLIQGGASAAISAGRTYQSSKGIPSLNLRGPDGKRYRQSLFNL